MKAGFGKTVQQHLQHLPAEIRQCIKFHGAEKAWGEPIFNVQTLFMRQGHAEVAPSGHGIGEGIWIWTGDLNFMCAPMIHIPGATVLEKVAFMKELTVDTLHDFCKNTQVFRGHANNDIVILPPASLTMFSTGSDLEALRWGFLQEGLPQDVYNHISDSLDGLEDESTRQWKDYITANMTQFSSNAC